MIYNVTGRAVLDNSYVADTYQQPNLHSVRFFP